MLGQFLEDFLGTRTLRRVDTRTLRRCSGGLIAEVVDRAAERSRSSPGGILLDGGPFDVAQGAWTSEGSLIAEVVDRAAERSRSSTGGILLDGGRFDCAQGAWTERREPGLFWGQLAPRRSRMLSFLFWTGLGGTFLGAGSSFAF